MVCGLSFNDGPYACSLCHAKNWTQNLQIFENRWITSILECEALALCIVDACSTVRASLVVNKIQNWWGWHISKNQLLPIEHWCIFAIYWRISKPNLWTCIHHVLIQKPGLVVDTPLSMMHFGDFWHPPCRWRVCPVNDKGGAGYSKF